MSIDELKAGFARLAEPVVPQEDPYGRLLRRARRSRRVRVTGWGTVLAAGFAAALLAPLAAPGAGTPTPVPSASTSEYVGGGGITPWVQRLLDTPARGNLASDHAFTSAVVARVNPRSLDFAPDLDRRTVLFAGDVGTYRAVLVALHSQTRQMGVWLVSGAGSSAQDLTDIRGVDTPARLKVLPEELAPFTATTVADGNTHRYLSIGLAPAGCQVATKDIEHPQSWQDSTTGDYLVRTDQLVATTEAYVRVTCDGVVRHQGPLNDGAQQDIVPPTPTPAQIDAIVASARGGVPDRTDVQKAMLALTQFEPVLLNECTSPYSGAVPGGPDRLVILACTTTVGKIAYASYSPGSGASLLSPYRPTDPVPVLGLPIDDQHQSRLLVIAPPTATLVQFGATDVLLAGGIGIMPYPTTSGPSRALDATGRVIANGTLPTPSDQSMLDVESAMVDNWS